MHLLWVRVIDKSYQQNASFIEGVGLEAHVAGPTSGRPAVARGAVCSVVDSGIAYYGSKPAWQGEVRCRV